MTEPTLRNAGALVTMIALAALVSACTASAVDAGAPPTGTVSATASASASPTPVPTSLPTSLPTSGLPAPIVDSGPRKHAMGTAVTDAKGAIVGYTVAEGDFGFAIGDRFGTTASEIKHGGGEYKGRNIENFGQIYPGDLVTF